MTDACGMCHCPGGDVSLMGCGCHLHVRCLPVALVAEFDPLHGFQATNSQLNLCPCCQRSFVDQIKLLPLWLDDLDKAVELQKKKNSGDEPAKDPHFQEMEAEASYVHLSRGGTGSVSASLNQNNHQRTGRWTTEEIAYTDYLVDAYDQGKLPIAQGVRLNDFLGDMLMCKGSRLTKKMKNAKLSSRSYELCPAIGNEKFVGVDTQLLSTLEDDFLKSIASGACRLELRFHMTKAWRTHFSNFCLQLSSPLLVADEWITSLELMEQRAAQAEEAIRKARRLRMGIALKTDVRAAQQGVFFHGMTKPEKPSKTTMVVNAQRPEKIQSSFPNDANNSITSSDDGDADFISDILDYPSSSKHQTTVGADDFAAFFDDLAAQPWNEVSSSNETKPNTNPSAVTFVEELVFFMEQENLPFEHVDLWVPSFAEGSIGAAGDEMRLFHAGQGTRGDLDAPLYFRMCEYGEYSTKFSFVIGRGLPGRVYSTDQPSWERHIHEQDPKIFERAGGAKVYGVKTGFGVPVVSKTIGRIVVVFYSVNDMPHDGHMIERIVAGLSRYTPTPKWKLVVEMGESQPEPTESSTRLMHYEHNISTTKKGIQVPHSVSMASMTDQHDKLAPASICMEETHEEEQHIASLLGQHMPISQLALGSGATDMSMLPFFMSLRLLLLRAPNRRSLQEAEKVDMIIKSYRGYQQGERKHKQIVDLLVQDWRYLSQNEEAPRAKFMDPSYSSHLMDGCSAMTTVTSAGIPTRQPQALSFVLPPNQDTDASVIGQDFKKRRVSMEEPRV